MFTVRVHRPSWHVKHWHEPVEMELPFAPFPGLMLYTGPDSIPWTVETVKYYVETGTIEVFTQ